MPNALTSAPVFRVQIEDDPEPDFSWLDADHYNPDHPAYQPTYLNLQDMEASRNPVDPYEYRNPENHLAYLITLLRGYSCRHCAGTGVVDEQGRPARGDVGLSCVACEDGIVWQPVASLGGVDFYAPSGDYPQPGVYDVGNSAMLSYVSELVRDMMAEVSA